MFGKANAREGAKKVSCSIRGIRLVSNAAAPYIISDIRNLQEKHRSTKGTDLFIVSFC